MAPQRIPEFLQVHVTKSAAALLDYSHPPAPKYLASRAHASGIHRVASCDGVPPSPSGL